MDVAGRDYLIKKREQWFEMQRCLAEKAMDLCILAAGTADLQVHAGPSVFQHLQDPACLSDFPSEFPSHSLPPTQQNCPLLGLCCILLPTIAVWPKPARVCNVTYKFVSKQAKPSSLQELRSQLETKAVWRIGGRHWVLIVSLLWEPLSKLHSNY